MITDVVLTSVMYYSHPCPCTCTPSMRIRSCRPGGAVHAANAFRVRMVIGGSPSVRCTPLTRAAACLRLAHLRLQFAQGCAKGALGVEPLHPC